MRRTRVLVVDDSTVIRRLLTDILSADPQIEVVGTAPNATVALAKIQQSMPDVVTLDVEMPDVNGLELLAQIRKLAPKVAVIMFSSLTQRAAATTLEALALGAADYVTKPSGTGSREASVEQVRTELLPKIRTLGRLPDPGALSVPVSEGKLTRPLTTAPRRSGRVDVVAIGSSTGGPNALATLFQAIPANLPVPVLIVQHMPPVFTELLATRLAATCKPRFREAHEGDELSPGGVWIAPGDHHMRLVRNGKSVKVALDREPPENSCRPAVDVLFRSVAATFGAHSLAVVLTGMGQDGLRGCEALRAAGGQIIVQDEATSVVWGMPGYVARAGMAERILPLEEIAGDILRRVPCATVPPFASSSMENHHAG
jgi:two-component system, chemotaxis family, protein-glutamate methylesterase/glutaminase